MQEHFCQMVRVTFFHRSQTEKSGERPSVYKNLHVLNITPTNKRTHACLQQTYNKYMLIADTHSDIVPQFPVHICKVYVRSQKSALVCHLYAFHCVDPVSQWAGELCTETDTVTTRICSMRWGWLHFSKCFNTSPKQVDTAPNAVISLHTQTPR